MSIKFDEATLAQLKNNSAAKMAVFALKPIVRVHVPGTSRQALIVSAADNGEETEYFGVFYFGDRTSYGTVTMAQLIYAFSDAESELEIDPGFTPSQSINDYFRDATALPPLFAN